MFQTTWSVRCARSVMGLVKVRPETDEPDARLGTPGKRIIGARVGTLQAKKVEPGEVELEEGYEVVFKGKPGWLVKLRGIDVSPPPDCTGNCDFARSTGVFIT